MNSKKRKGFALLEIAMIAVIMAIIFSSTITNMPSQTRIFLEDDFKKAEIISCDKLLSLWAKSHSGKYPDNLLDLNMFIDNKNYQDMFSYHLSGDKFKYKLTVKLNDGSTYTSPNSNL